MVTVRSLQKWHGAGNDFLVDVRRAGEGEPWTSDLARAVCARATGVGADGLIVAVLEEPVAMTLYNADGSVAEMSGNGARCLAAAVRRTTKSDRDELVVQTAAGVKTVRLLMKNETSGYGSVDMGEVTFGDEIDGAWGVANVGNPHVAVFDDEAWSDVAREELAAKPRTLTARQASALGDGVAHALLQRHAVLKVREQLAVPDGLAGRATKTSRTLEKSPHFVEETLVYPTLKTRVNAFIQHLKFYVEPDLNDTHRSVRHEPFAVGGERSARPESYLKRAHHAAFIGALESSGREGIEGF